MDTNGHNGSGGRPASACIMVCIGYNPSSQRLIGRAKELAQALRARLIALHIQPDESTAPCYRAMLEENMAIARRLGAQTLIERGESIAETLVRVAQTHGVTHIVMGESARSRWAEIQHGSLVRQILQASRGIDVYIVADPA